MRQLVSVVTDTHISIFLDEGHEGAEVQQIVQTINPGFGVREVIDLGSAMTTLLGLNNGKSKPRRAIVEPVREVAVEAVEAVEEVVEEVEPPELTTRGTPRRRAKATQRRRWGIVMDDVLVYVREHPGLTRREIAGELLHDQSPLACQTIGNHLGRLRNAGEVVVSERPARPGEVGRSGVVLTFRAHEPPA